jgi:integrase
VQEARTAVNRVIEYFPTLAELTVRSRDRWLKTETRAVSSVQKSIGFVRNYYNWLKANQHVGASEVNPFVAKEIILNKKLKEKENYLPFEMFELMEIKQAVRSMGDERLLRYIEIAQWTGMRLAEIAQLSGKSIVTVDGVKCIRVKDDAKSKAGSRRLIPIAKTLADRVSLKELPAPPPPVLNKRTKKLVPYAGVDVGKKFGRLKTKLGYGPLHVFHSIRKTCTTHFEQAEVPEGITADIVGHKKQTMTYGLYSGGTSVEQRKRGVDAMEKLMLRREAEANVLPFSGDKS